jgi:O-antigen/teichoic acid export membrane protein
VRLGAGKGSPIVARSAWALIAQGVSSASNVILSLVVLSVATRSEFATFSVCLMSYLLAGQLSRSFLSVPILILYSAAGPTHGTPRPERAALGLVVVTAIGAAPVVAGLGLVVAGGRIQFLVLAALLPFLLYQDSVRHVAFARGEPKLAAASDLLWLALQLAAFALALALVDPSPTVMVALWALSGAASGCVYGALLRATPRFRGMADWLRDNKKLCLGLLSEFALISGSNYILYYGLTVVAGTDQLGRIRAAQTFIGPVTVALLGGAALGVSESVRLRADPGRLGRFAGRLALALAGGAAVAGVVAYWLLPVVGPRFFPNTWAGARPVVPVLSLFAIALALSIGAASPMRVLGEVPWIVRTRIFTGALAIGIGLPAAAWLGANGVVAALAISEWLFAALVWRAFLRCLARATLPAAGKDEVPVAAEVDAAAWSAEP